MSFNKVSSFFINNGKISYIRTLIVLLISQILFFGFGYLFYLVSNSHFLELFFNLFTEKVLKNSIIVSIFFYSIIAYIVVSNLNKSNANTGNKNKITGIDFIMILFAVYSFYMIIDSGLLSLELDAFIKNHYYFHITYLMAMFNFSLILFLSVTFMENNIDYENIHILKKQFLEATLTGFLYLITAIILNMIFKELFLFIYNYSNSSTDTNNANEFLSTLVLIFYCIISVLLNIFYIVSVGGAMKATVKEYITPTNEDNEIPVKNFDENEIRT